MEQLTLKTDHNVVVQVELAPLSSRLTAVFIDLVLMSLYVFFMTLIISSIFISDFGSRGVMYQFWYGFFMLIVYLPFLLYSPLMEFFTKGQTVGKMMLNLRVVQSNGENADFKSYFLRWMFRPIELYVLTLGPLGLILFFAGAVIDSVIVTVSGNSQRLGDIMANTVVVHKKPTKNYTIKDVLAIKTQEKYSPVYPEIVQFTDEDMMLVKSTLNRLKQHPTADTKALAIALAEKIATHLGIEMPKKGKLKFLEQTLQDYIVLTR